MKIIYSLSIGFLILILQGCGGESEDNASSNLSGTAATGAPIVGTIKIVGSKGQEVNVDIDSAGAFSLDVSSLTAPFMVSAIPTDTTEDKQYSFAASSNTTVNVTPLTTLAVFEASGKENLDALINEWATRSDEITQADIDEQKAIINANFSPKFIDAGLDAAAFDIFTSSFNADNAGFDGVLDTITFSVNFEEGTSSIEVSGGNFSFNPNITISGSGSGSGTAISGSITITGTGVTALGLSTFTPDTYSTTDTTFGPLRSESFLWTETKGDKEYSLLVGRNTTLETGVVISANFSVLENEITRSWTSVVSENSVLIIGTSDTKFNSAVLLEIAGNPTSITLSGTLLKK